MLDNISVNICLIVLLIRYEYSFYNTISNIFYNTNINMNDNYIINVKKIK